MKSRLFPLLLLGAVVALPGRAQAESAKLARVTAPFAFSVGHRELPAGDYVLTQVDDSGLWRIASTDGHHEALFLTVAAAGDKAVKRTAIKFQDINGRPYLASLWTAGQPSGRLVVSTDKRLHREAEASERTASAAPAGERHHRHHAPATS